MTSSLVGSEMCIRDSDLTIIISSSAFSASGLRFGLFRDGRGRSIAVCPGCPHLRHAMFVVGR
eukprot:1840751-Prorocentrum_lima.AAC.1